MAKRCKSIAGQRVSLGPGQPIIPGCELIEGSGIFVSKEEFPFMFAEIDGVAGDNGAVVIWPDTGNDLMRYGEGETVPVGTTLHEGCVIENGELKCAPHTTQDEAVAAAAGSFGNDGDDGDGGGEGFCIGSGIAPTDEEEDWLNDIANFELPDLQAWALSGFTAKVQELMGKLNKILGKLSAEVDKIVSQAVLKPEDICKDPLKSSIQFMMAQMAKLMELIPVLQKIIQVIKIIRKIIKIVKRILKWTPPFIVPIVEALLKILNLSELIDMCVSILIKSIGKFAAVIPLLYAQLQALIAQCAGQQGPMSKEDCEANGGTWIEPDDLKNLQTMYDKIVSADLSLETDEEVGFCSITEHLDKESCEAAGGVWTSLDTDTNFDDVDASALSDELSKQLEELDRCFASPELNEYLKGL